MPNTSLQVLHNSGWCWFQDPRAIIHNDTLIFGGVAGNGIGDAAVGVFDLKCNQLIGRKTLHPQFDHDDHNSLVFYARDDGSLITVYARHTVVRAFIIDSPLRLSLWALCYDRSSIASASVSSPIA